MSCVIPEELVQAAEGEPVDHIDACEQCTKQVEDLQETISWLKNLPEESEAPVVRPRRRWGVIGVAAGLLLCSAVLLGVVASGVFHEEVTPADVDTNKSRLSQLIVGLLNGKDVEDHILEYGWKALPALDKYSNDHPEAADLIARINAGTIRVLFLDQTDRNEFSYLKDGLLQDNNVYMHTLVADRKDDETQEHTRNAVDPVFRRPIDAFPRSMRELLIYDVVILGDVDLDSIGGKETAAKLRRFVGEFGGGVVFMSGPLQNPHTYVDTDLAALLPIIPGGTPGETREGLGYRITGDGRLHSVVKNAWPELEDDITAVVDKWEKKGLPSVGIYAPVKNLKPGSAALVELTGTGEKDNPPLFVVENYGRGRVFWSGTEDTHLWRSATGEDAWFYPFWRGAINWSRLGKPIGLQRHRIQVERDFYKKGDNVYIQASAYDTEFEPMDDETLTITIEPPKGDAFEVVLKRDKSRKGFYAGHFKPDTAGDYTLLAGETGDSTGAFARLRVLDK